MLTLVYTLHGLIFPKRKWRIKIEAEVISVSYTLLHVLQLKLLLFLLIDVLVVILVMIIIKLYNVIIIICYF